MAGVLGSGILNSLISLTLVFIPPIARVAESVTTQVRNQDFVEAARATGAGSTRIIIEHVLANVTGPILTYASSLVSVSIIIASGLSFLGLGAAPPTADWGLMLNTLRQAVYVAPVNAVLPGVMIFLTSVSFNLVSDSLRTAMDVRA
jgi:peptide/nickel transport system permease protein